MKQIIVSILVVVILSTTCFAEVTFKRIEGVEKVTRENISVDCYVVYKFETESGFWFGGDAAKTGKIVAEKALQNYGVPVLVNKEEVAQSYLKWENGQWRDTRYDYDRTGADFVVTGTIRLLDWQMIQEKGVGVIIPGENPWVNIIADILVDEKFNEKKGESWDSYWKNWERQRRVNNLQHTKEIVAAEVVLKVIDTKSQIIIKEISGIASSKTKTNWNYDVTSGYQNAQSANANKAVVAATEDAIMQLLGKKNPQQTSNSPAGISGPNSKGKKVKNAAKTVVFTVFSAIATNAKSSR